MRAAAGSSSAPTSPRRAPAPHGPTRARPIRPAPVNGRPDRAGPGPKAGVISFSPSRSPLWSVSASFCPFLSPNHRRRRKRATAFGRLRGNIPAPTHRRTPIARGRGLARCLVLHTFPALCRIGVSVTKSDVKPGAGPARRPAALCRHCPVVPPHQPMAT